jgi:drug/metabolite transporter (DMT)-like permease
MFSVALLGEMVTGLQMVGATVMVVSLCMFQFRR